MHLNLFDVVSESETVKLQKDDNKSFAAVPSWTHAERKKKVYVIPSIAARGDNKHVKCKCWEGHGGGKVDEYIFIN